MLLDPDIEALFTIVPLLAAIPRGQWQVTSLGGITNRSYRLRSGALDLVLRWPGESASRYLDRRAEAGNVRAVAELGLAPRLLAADAQKGWYITAFESEAQPLTAEALAEPATLSAALGLLTRLHRAPIVFPFRQGLFQAIDLYLDLAPTPLMLDLRQALEPVRLALSHNPLAAVPCHIDPNPANFLRRSDSSLLLIDWEFAAMEEPLWDLAAVALEADVAPEAEYAAIEPLIGTAQWPRFELYKSALGLVAASWCEAEIVAGNKSSMLIALRDARVGRLRRRLADPAHLRWLENA